MVGRLRLEESRRVFARNREVVAGGVVSLNRKVHPEIVFVKGRGSRVWDADGNEYIDYHAGFAPYLLGHNDPDVQRAVREALDEDLTLMGSGTTYWEGQLAELLVEVVPSIERVQIVNTGSEATYLAIRLARAYTRREGIIIMQGGYNGWHNEVAHNVMTPLSVVGPRISPGEYRVIPESAGIPNHVLGDVHVVNFNDVESIEYVVKRHSIAAIIMEPILQNIGVVLPKPGYLEEVRRICTREGIVLIFDEVKTGFRHALGGYQSLCGVLPDLSVFGKAIANGYPLAVVGGRREIMELVADPDPARRVLIAGTYNAHPVPTKAAIATVQKLRALKDTIYPYLENLGQRLQQGLEDLFREAGITASISRQGSAFCAYFMDHLPVDWHDIAAHHDFEFDRAYRATMIEEGVYYFPLPTKQASISYAHTVEDIDETLERTRRALARLAKA